MFKNKNDFLARYRDETVRLFGRVPENCANREKYEALVRLICGIASRIRTDTARRFDEHEKKEVYYFSMEFLIGRLLKNYLLNLGVLDIVRDGLSELGTELDDICACESDPGLGNGGLGRLAACFLDSMAYMDINATGIGIRFRYGLFRQRIDNGWQLEEPDAWMEDGYPWETRMTDEAVSVKFGGRVERVLKDGKASFVQRDYYVIRAIPYNVPVVGYGGKTVNKLKLWQAEPFHEHFDLAAFNRGDYAEANKSRSEAEAISCILYPDDTTDAGKTLRLKQEYFFVCAGLTYILRKYKMKYGDSKWAEFPNHVSLHTNDTHPALVVPELMRLLLDEEGLSWEAAWDIVTRAVSYTNHTVLPEALEKWPVHLFSQLLPRIYMIVEEINRRYLDNFDRSLPDADALMAATAILWDDQVKMANLSVIGSHSVNGVASLHTEILKTDTLKEFYSLMPDKFNNKTNGVSHRRFLIESNPELASLLTEYIGDGWIADPKKLGALLEFKDDPQLLARLRQVKYESKRRLTQYIADKNHIEIDPDSIFDVQVKRIHAYKRQLLHIFKIMCLYNRLKADPDLDIPPCTFIMSGKAAQSYTFAKETIKLYCSVADVINSDSDMDGKLKVVFLENFNVSSAQLIYPAADISEQISTAGKEASGTGNMKFMFNGAVTLGTVDGANVEIRDLVGEDNIITFGVLADEAMSLHKNGYSSFAEYSGNEELRLIMDQLVNGFFEKSGFAFWGVRNALLQDNDEYLVLKDFAPYMKAWEKAAKLYTYEPDKWYSMAAVNIAKAGYFTSDRTIAEYASGIWKL